MGDRPVVAVATSGGRDSVALLHATLAAAQGLGLQVVALHVHHGLMAEADGWLAGLEARCALWARAGQPVRLLSERLRGKPGAGESVEAWARRERYRALSRLARETGATLVLLGHHRRDQAETVLLQALRGAGPAGLAAMPRVAQRDGLSWARPWLDQPSESIDAYVSTHALDFVVDASNADQRFARSRLRTGAMPALRAAFPDVDQALAAVARHAHEARSILDEVADEDLRRLDADDDLPLAGWLGLSPARRANALRHWLARRLGGPVADSLVQRVCTQCVDDRTRRWPVDAQRGLRAWRGRLSLVARVTVEVVGGGQRGVPAAIRVVDMAGAPSFETRLSLLRCASYAVAGWRGRVEVFPTQERGIAPHRLAPLVARARQGGERFQLQPAGIARSLKKQYQAVGVAAEGRSGPLLFDAGGALLFAPGLGVDARAWASPGAAQWGLRWVDRDEIHEG